MLPLVAVTAVEVCIAGPRRLGRLARAWQESPPWDVADAAFSLLWLPVLCAVVLLTVRLGGRARQAGAVMAHSAAGARTRSTRGKVRDRALVRGLLRSSRTAVVGQPILGLTAGEVRGLEALARFPDGGAPDEWFARAAAVGLGAELELSTLERALELQAQLPAGAYLSVNASPQVITDPRFSRLLAGAPLPLSRLVLEVTEHDEVMGYAELTRALAPLRGAGMRLAVDDVGAGYASFKHVLELRPDVIKLDRSLIHRIDREAGSQAVVTAVALVALELGAQLTAEGVETQAELTTVETLGVDAVQGYLVGRPGSDPATWLSLGSGSSVARSAG